ncbi:MAG: hypothetical protein H0X39_01125 [Actinobacteria bacterium]|nr:hypothetical protein [Actinomycetota bacterium]
MRRPRAVGRYVVGGRVGTTSPVAQGSITPTFGVFDIDTAVAHLRGHGVKVEDWHETPGMVQLSTFYDQDGSPWLLAQTRPQPTNQV